MASDILIIDDEEDIRELVAGILKDEGYETRVAATAQEALQAINARIPKLIFLDIWFAPYNGKFYIIPLVFQYFKRFKG